MRQLVRVLALAGLASLAVACGVGQGPAARSGGAASPGERLWRSKCGACHVPVAPQSHDRAYLETALGRHRGRVRLSEPEWRSIVDFLATAPDDLPKR